MPQQHDKDAWTRLGILLERQRVMLDTRYSNLSLFAEERGLNWRMAWDAEKGRRTNFKPATRLALDIAYGWEPGSVDAVLAGGDPVPAALPAPPPAAEPREVTVLRQALSAPERVIMDSDLSDQDKAELVAEYRAAGGDTIVREFADKLRARARR